MIERFILRPFVPGGAYFSAPGSPRNMLDTELLDKTLFLFGDGCLGQAVLWIRDPDGVGSVAVPCRLDLLQSVLVGVPYQMAAPGVDCEMHPTAEGVEVRLNRPGGIAVCWTVPRDRMESVLDAHCRAEGESGPFVG